MSAWQVVLLSLLAFLILDALLLDAAERLGRRRARRAIDWELHVDQAIEVVS